MLIEKETLHVLQVRETTRVSVASVAPVRVVEARTVERVGVVMEVARVISVSMKGDKGADGYIPWPPFYEPALADNGNFFTDATGDVVLLFGG